MKISNQVEKNNINNCTAWCVLMKASVEATQIIKLQAENVMMPTVSWKLNGKETRMHFPQYLLPASANCTGTGREIQASGKGYCELLRGGGNFSDARHNGRHRILDE